MRITKVKIKNYKALKDIEIPLQDLGILIGQNDAGKTSVLNAIDAFFKKKKLKETDWHKKNIAEPVVIELSFEDVPGEHETLIENGITIMSVFKDPETLPSYSYKTTDDEYVSIKPADTKKYFLEKQFILIPVNRDIDDQFSASKARGLLRIILDEVIRKDLKDNAKAQKSIKDIEDFLRGAIKNPEQKIQGFLREQVENDIQFAFGDFNVDPVGGMSFTNSVSDSNTQSFNLDSRGAGTQNNAIIALFRYLSVSGVAENFIFGIEEPENSLHPKAQRQLLSAILDISESTQVIVTTHSPVFIDRSHYKSNILMTLSSKGETIARIFQDIGADDVRGELGIRVSDALLAGGGNCALLVEGKTEEESFPIFMKIMGLDYINLGISIIPIKGSSFEQCRILVRLLNRYDIPCVVVLDNDGRNYAEDLERTMNLKDSDIPNLKKVFCWKEGAIENHYPPEIVLEAIEKGDKGIRLTPEDRKSVQDSSEKGIKKYAEILRRHKLDKEWLKNLIGGKGTKLMQKKNVPDEIQEVLNYVKKIAEGGKG